MTEIFEALREIAKSMRSIAADIGYFVDKVRAADAKDAELERVTTPATAPATPPGDL